MDDSSIQSDLSGEFGREHPFTLPEDEPELSKGRVAAMDAAVNDVLVKTSYPFCRCEPCLIVLREAAERLARECRTAINEIRESRRGEP